MWCKIRWSSMEHALVRDPEKFPAWLQPSRDRRMTFFANAARSLSEQLIEPIEPEPANTSALDQRLHSALAALPDLRARSCYAISKRWITAPSKLPWVLSLMARSEGDEHSRPYANNFRPVLLQWTKAYGNELHDEIDTCCAADLHNEQTEHPSARISSIAAAWRKLIRKSNL